MTVNKPGALHQVADEFSAQTPNLFACFNRGWKSNFVKQNWAFAQEDHFEGIVTSLSFFPLQTGCVVKKQNLSTFCVTVFPKCDF